MQRDSEWCGLSVGEFPTATVPERLGFASPGEEFFQRCVQARLLIVPGRTFSSRDTHFRLSFATPMANLQKGLEILVGLMQ